MTSAEVGGLLDRGWILLMESLSESVLDTLNLDLARKEVLGKLRVLDEEVLVSARADSVRRAGVKAFV